MAKQLGLDQAFGQGGAVYADERLVPPRAAGHNGLRHQLFSRAAFPTHQHVDRALGHAADGVIHQPHGLAAPDQLAKRVSLAGLLAQPAVLDFRGPFLERGPEHCLHFLEIYRRDKTLTDSGLFELPARSLVMRSGKPEQDQVLVMLAKLAHQPQHLIVRGMGGFKIQNDGLDRGLGEQRQYLFTRAQKRGMEGGRQYFLRRQLHRLIRSHNRYARGCAGGYSIGRHRKTLGISAPGKRIQGHESGPDYRSIFHPWWENNRPAPGKLEA